MRARFPRYVAPALAAGLLAATLGTAPTGAATSHRRSWSIAPGITYRQWDFTSRAGPQRIHVLDVDPAEPGVSLGYQSNVRLQVRAPTSTLVASDPQSVAGVNGNYFDISDTGAPLGIGRSRARGLLHAPQTGWNNAFYQTADGRYQVGPLALTAQIAEHPTWPVTGLNTPHAKPDAITLYTFIWGKAPGKAVVDTPNTQVREVHVRDGVVRRNSRHPMRHKPFEGYLLVGLGHGAHLLKSLAVGSHLTARWSLDQRPQMAITGSQVLVRDGHVTAANDQVLAPRTAVGIDTDTGHVLLVTLDGRETNARGATLRGWAKLLAGLGMDDAINLDGGGSTTMVARDAAGTATSVVNSPSLGHERWVPDALLVDYAPPG